MSPSSVPDCLMLCPSCPKDAVTKIRFFSADEEVRCPGCRSRFRVVTREVADYTRVQPGRHGLYSYRAFTAEKNGRPLARSFEAQGGIKLEEGNRASFVWRRGTLIGVANQSNRTWYRIPEPIRGRAGGLAMKGTLAGALAVTAWFAYTALADLAPAALSSPLSLAVVLLVGAALALAPLLAPAGGESAGQIRKHQKQDGFGQGPYIR